jgi:hypothetical protein
MASTVRFRIAFFFTTIAAVILGGCNNGSSPSGSSAANAASSGGLSISGDPAQSIAVGANYSFRPTASEASSGATLSFAITNQPAWASFDAATGTLSGIPSAANVGVSPEIEISVSDGSASATLAAFTIDVTQGTPGDVTLSWTPPLVNASSSTPEVAGYHIYYGENKRNMTHVVTIASRNTTDYVIKHLTIGTWYFAIASYSTEHIESALSAVVPVTI